MPGNIDVAALRAAVPGRVVGRVLLRETSAGIANLVVGLSEAQTQNVAEHQDSPAAGATIGRSLVSGFTGRSGEFELQVPMHAAEPDAQKPEQPRLLAVIIYAPSDPQPKSPNYPHACAPPPMLHCTLVSRPAPGSTEAVMVRLPYALLQQYGLEDPFKVKPPKGRAYYQRLLAARAAANRFTSWSRRVGSLFRDPVLMPLLYPIIKSGVRPRQGTLPAGALPTVDPWRSLGRQTAGEWAVTVKLVDGRSAELTRRLQIETDGTRRLELLVRTGEGEEQTLSRFSPGRLPLYGADGLSDKLETVVLCEGIAATDALRALGVMAVGTLTGPTFSPSRQALAPLAKASQIILWPGSDTSSRQHLLHAGVVLAALGVKDFRIVPPNAGPPEAANGDMNSINKLLAGSPQWNPLATGLPPIGRQPVVTSASGARLSLPAQARPKMERLVADPPLVRFAQLRRVAAQVEPLLRRAEAGENLTTAELSQMNSAVRVLTNTFRQPGSGAASSNQEI